MLTLSEAEDLINYHGRSRLLQEGHGVEHLLGNPWRKKKRGSLLAPVGFSRNPFRVGCGCITLSQMIFSILNGRTEWSTSGEWNCHFGMSRLQNVCLETGEKTNDALVEARAQFPVLT